MHVDVTKMGVRFRSVDEPATKALLEQLEVEELAMPVDGGWDMAWPAIYVVLRAFDEYGVVESDLGLPAIDESISISVARDDGTSITDEKFNVRVKDFLRNHEAISVDLPAEMTPRVVIDKKSAHLLSEATWNLLERISRSRRRGAPERTREGNLEVLADVRSLAEASGAVMDVYLQRTRVLRPKELFIDLEVNETPGGKVITMVPRFDGQPEGWLAMFDKLGEIRKIYRIPEGADYCEVIVEPAVRDGLQVIKSVPGRRVAGQAAQRLLSNPFSFLGPDVAEVFNVGQIEERLAELRNDVCSFMLVQADDAASPIELLIEPIGDEPTVESTVERFASPAMLQGLCRKLKEAIEARDETFEWRAHRLQVDGDAITKLQELAVALRSWIDATQGEEPSTAPVDLSVYSDRVESIGIETPYSIIKIPRPKELGAWMPDEVLLRYVDKASNSTTPVALTTDQVRQLPGKIEEAEKAGISEVKIAGAPPMSIDTARTIVANTPAGVFDTPQLPPDVVDIDKPIGKKVGPKPSLLIASNIDERDYVEKRAEFFVVPQDRAPQLPRCMRPGIQLLPHQERGVAWLQHLCELGSENCRGALLADDMGLGKTIQLLTFAFNHLETSENCGPVLVVAPVSLLENWRMEIEKFFDVPAGTVLSLYGTAIRDHRAGPDDVDDALFATQRKLLRDGWVGDAQVVLTTYDTVRDLEFSLAEIDWSFVMCDEAQKIKNPNALVTRAMKKLKARFRVAATGTPVENSLQDMWSIFDFVQPGLLEPLNRFAKEYQRPIETRTPEQAQKLELLRALLAPQILRRTKREVATDLPEKRRDQPSLQLAMSDEQLRLYQSAVFANREKQFENDNERRLATIHVLQHLRRICCDPRRPGEPANTTLPFDAYRELSPKFDWLVDTLDIVRRADEKAIVFIEARDIQRQLKIYLDEYYGLDITIINGETSTAAKSEFSRQKLIDAFQARGGFNVIILSPLAAGVGLNIQAANHVIHYMRHWNPAREDQATDRAYRIGQKRPVTVYTPIVCGPEWPSFDERLDGLLEHKRQLAEDMYNGADDVGPGDMEAILSVFDAVK